MPEWLIERGIGETRYALVEHGEIVEARIELDGIARHGALVSARLIDAGSGGRNAVAREEGGAEFLLPRGAGGTTEGSPLQIVVTREAIPGAEAWKRPLARLAQDGEQTRADLSATAGTLPDAWNDLIEEARSGIVRFAGGELRISPTPAMTLIDVDGQLEPAELAVRGADEAAKAIRRLDIGGSIGIDLPTSGSKQSRHAAAAALEDKLPQPFERTAVNGFGFIQVVRPRRRASLVELAQDRISFEARALLRSVAMGSPGPKRLVARPALIALLERRKDWLDALSRQVGGKVGLRADSELPISGAYAETP